MAFPQMAHNDLIARQWEITRLREEHRAIDQQIHQLSQLPWIPPDTEYQIARLKKLRLATKDQLFALVHGRTD